MLPKASQNEQNNLQKIIEQSMQFSTQLFVPFCIVVLLFAAARPTILLLFTALSWGAAFFATSETH